MIHQVKSNLTIILTLKTLHYLLINILILIGVYMFFSQFYLDNELRELNQKEYAFNYLFNSVLILKINIVVVIVYVSMMSLHIRENCYLFVQDTSRLKYYLSHVIGLLLIVFCFVIIEIFIIAIIGIMLGGYDIKHMILNGMTTLLFFSFYYVSLCVLLSYMTPSKYGLIGVIVLYIILNIFTPYLTDINEITRFDTFVLLLSNDIIMYENLKMYFLNGTLYVFALSMLLLLIGFYVFKDSDII